MKTIALALVLSFCLPCLFAQEGVIRRKLHPEREEIWTLAGGSFSFEDARKKDIWIWDGETLRQEGRENRFHIYRWDGESFMPDEGDEDYNTFYWDGKQLESADRSVDPRRYVFDEEESEWYPVQGNRSKNTWVVEGDMPVPLVGFVIFNILEADDDDRR